MRLCQFRALTALTASIAIAPTAVTARSTPISNIRYTVAFDSTTAENRTIKVAMTFDAAGAEPVLLSLPAWTPGAYEISNFAKSVLDFEASSNGRPLDWDKTDYDTWRIQPSGGRSVRVTFGFRADSLDNAMSWATPNFLLFNGTNIFLFPEGQGFDFKSTVSVKTETGWNIATGMKAAGSPRTYQASNYHDLVDMPFFIGRFDYDSTRIADRWVRLATYPVGSLSGSTRGMVWEWLRKMFPPMIQVFQDEPFETYTIMQIADSAYAGASGLEHQNSHVDVVTPSVVGSPFLNGLYSHEIFHAWNVKRLRPADLVPYRYDAPQPTPWLWVSEGITDYYADLILVRGGLVNELGFYALTQGKMLEVSQAVPTALEDASLSTWVHPVDGSSYIYYPKGALAGLMLDILIRDASDNHNSLDGVLGELYQTTYKEGHGFTRQDWWRAVSRAANGRSFDDFHARYIDGREPFPWATLLPLAGLRMAQDSVREPRLGIYSQQDSSGVTVTQVEAGGAAERAGVRKGDRLLSIGDIPVTSANFGASYRARYGDREGESLPIKVQRDGQELTLAGKTALAVRVTSRLEADPNAAEKAARIRTGILRGVTDQ